MKTTIIKSLFVGIFLFGYNSSYSQKLATITVTIENTTNSDGQLFVYLFGDKNADDYPIKTGKSLKHKITKIHNNKAEVVFENIEYGKYAIAVHHDEDGDNKVNKNFLGIPTEDFGASNNAKGFMGPPDFEDAAFEVIKPEVEVKINMD